MFSLASACSSKRTRIVSHTKTKYDRTLSSVYVSLSAKCLSFCPTVTKIEMNQQVLVKITEIQFLDGPAGGVALSHADTMAVGQT